MSDESEAAIQEAKDAHVEAVGRTNGDAAAIALAKHYDRPESVAVERMGADALERLQQETKEMRTYLRDNGWLFEKSWRNPQSGRTEIRDVFAFAGLANWFRMKSDNSDKVVLGCGSMVGAPETRPIKCVDAGCRDAKSDQVGWISVAVASREKAGQKEFYSRSGHACPHTCSQVVRDFLMADSETRALSLTVRAALGIQSATREEMGPDTPEARANVVAEKWEQVDKKIPCWKFFDGGGNAKAEPFGYKWRRDENNRFQLWRRTDEGAPPHPPVLCEAHGFRDVPVDPSLPAYIREGRGMNDAEFLDAIKNESRRLGVDLDFVEVEQMELNQKADLFRKLQGTRTRPNA